MSFSKNLKSPSGIRDRYNWLIEISEGFLQLGQAIEHDGADYIDGHVWIVIKLKHTNI